MEEKINNLIQALLCKRVEGCKCDKSVNKAVIRFEKIVIYCDQCGWGEC